MKTTFFVLAFLICLISEAQRPGTVETNKGTTGNVNLKVDPSKMKIADTTNIKLSKLVEDFNIQKAENDNLKEQVAAQKEQLTALEISLNSLTTKITEIQKSNLALKLPAFQVVAANGNLWNLKNSKEPDPLIGLDAIRIDNPACDGNPAAILVITQQLQTTPANWGGENSDMNNGGGALYAVYSIKYKKWFIQQYKMVVDGYSDGGHTVQGRWATFKPGDRFNVLVTKATGN